MNFNAEKVQKANAATSFIAYNWWNRITAIQSSPTPNRDNINEFSLHAAFFPPSHKSSAVFFLARSHVETLFILFSDNFLPDDDLNGNRWWFFLSPFGAQIGEAEMVSMRCSYRELHTQWSYRSDDRNWAKTIRWTNAENCSTRWQMCEIAFSVANIFLKKTKEFERRAKKNNKFIRNSRRENLLWYSTCAKPTERSLNIQICTFSIFWHLLCPNDTQQKHGWMKVLKIKSAVMRRDVYMTLMCFFFSFCHSVCLNAHEIAETCKLNVYREL